MMIQPPVVTLIALNSASLLILMNIYGNYHQAKSDAISYLYPVRREHEDDQESYQPLPDSPVHELLINFILPKLDDSSTQGRLNPLALLSLTKEAGSCIGYQGSFGPMLVSSPGSDAAAARSLIRMSGDTLNLFAQQIKDMMVYYWNIICRFVSSKLNTPTLIGKLRGITENVLRLLDSPYFSLLSFFLLSCYLFRGGGGTDGKIAASARYLFKMLLTPC